MELTEVQIGRGGTGFRTHEDALAIAKQINETYKSDKFCPLIHDKCKTQECVAWILAYTSHDSNVINKPHNIQGNMCGSLLVRAK